tara:strand:- start:90 stop:230 length:141 start_codon:yes stop_codon:yes gene_type:complete
MALVAGYFTDMATTLLPVLYWEKEILKPYPDSKDLLSGYQLGRNEV